MDFIKPRSEIIFSCLHGNGAFVWCFLIKPRNQILPLIDRGGIALDDILLGQTQLRFRGSNANELAKLVSMLQLPQCGLCSINAETPLVSKAGGHT